MCEMNSLFLTDMWPVPRICGFAHTMVILTQTRSLTSANECNEKKLRPNLLGLKDARIGTIRGWKNTL
jgi:hypothetical protein